MHLNKDLWEGCNVIMVLIFFQYLFATVIEILSITQPYSRSHPFFFNITILISYIIIYKHVENVSCIKYFKSSSSCLLIGH